MPGPLAPLTVLDLSRVLAGPWCTQLLADLGATVIKIERPGTGDDTRAWGPPYLKDADGHDTSEAAYYLCCNRGKLSVAVDFTTPEGRRIVADLARQADVLVENFKVGGLAKYGLDYENLARINPRLVYERLFGPNLGAELVMGVPPTIKTKAAGSVEFLNATGTVLEVENWAPTLLLNYHFFEQGATWRPYVGIGINYTKFKNAKSSIADDVDVGSSWGPAVQVGIDYAITKEISAFASLAAVKVKSKVVASGATVLTTTVDYRPTVYSVGVSYRF